MTVLPPIQTRALGALTPGLFNPEEYDLFIEINPTTCCYLLFNHKEQKADYLGEYQATEPYEFSNLILLNQVFAKDKMLQLSKFNQIVISSSLSQYDILPNEVELVPLLQQKWNKTDPIAAIGAHVRYQQETQIIATIQAYFPTADYKHRITGLMQHALLNNLKAADQVVLDFCSKSITILAFKNNELQLLNSYSYSGAEDIIYYLQLVFVQLQFDQLKTPVWLSGEISRQSLIWNELIKYFDAIQLVHRNSAIKLNSAIAELPSSFYFSLIGLLPCAS